MTARLRFRGELLRATRWSVDEAATEGFPAEPRGINARAAQPGCSSHFGDRAQRRSRMLPSRRQGAPILLARGGYLRALKSLQFGSGNGLTRRPNCRAAVWRGK